MTIDIKPFQAVPAPPTLLKTTDLSSLGSWLRRLWETTSFMRMGKLSCVFNQTLAPSATLTVIKNAYLGRQSVIILNPVTPQAAALMLTAPYPYALEVNRADGQWTLTHASAAGPLDFLIAVIG